MAKGIVVKYLCTNPSCSFSETPLIDKKALTTGSSKYSFPVLKCCPKCKSGIDMINFVSGSVQIKEDKISQSEEEEE